MAHYPDIETPAPPRPLPWERLLPGQLWHHHDFMRLWTGQTVSQLGSTITREALPYTAILLLGATPIQMGLLGAAGAAPLLLFGLLAGVWVDRLRRRPLMLAADLLRALLLLSVPLAYLLGTLRIEQLFVITALMGVLNVLFDVAYQAYLPGLVGREQLVEGNSKLGASDSLAEIAGTPLGGLLVQLVSGPVTFLLDALSFLWSAAALAGIRSPEPPLAPPAERQRVWHDVGTGLRLVWANPLLRPLAAAAVVSNFFGWFFGALYGLYALRTLGMSPAVLGLVVACGGIGALLGALLVGRVTTRFGLGPTIVGGLLVAGAADLLIWLAGGALFAALPLMIVAQLVGDAAGTLVAINGLSLRQRITPDALLGRVNASMDVLGKGVGTLGLLAGGLLAETIGLRPTVGVAALGSLLACVILFCSPVRRLR